jgi:RNA recognition motif-containing protein
MKKLYVGNLSFEASEQSLRDWFSEAGVQADNVTFIRDRDTNQLRGFGFVEITNDEQANRAIQEFNGKDFLGRALVVNEARPPREGGGGGRGRGEGGGGRRRDR